jgi:hypothetical protein
MTNKSEQEKCNDDLTIYNVKRALSRCIPICLYCCVVKSPKIEVSYCIHFVSLITAGMSSTNRFCHCIFLALFSLTLLSKVHG